MTFALLAALAVVLGATTASADPALDNPLHNYSLATDVDANGLVTPRDLLLVFNELQRGDVDPLTAQLQSSETYYWDTNDSGTITPNDALRVINTLLTQPVPEPGAVISGGIALAALLGLCWRRRRRG